MELLPLRKWTPNHVSLALLLATALAGLVWLAVSTYAAPHLIASVYRGESLPIFNRMISGQSSHPLAEYLSDWNRLRWRWLLDFFLVALLVVLVMRPEFQRALPYRFLSPVFELVGPPVPWSRTTYIALLTLVILWAARMYTTWATWGSLTVDCGREMYVPALLSQGKMLYGDVYYPYTPAAPYFNSYLFRTFGLHLNVLYWAGSLSALVCALLIYLIGMRLSSWVAGWAAAAVVLVQAFQRGIFNFALPYAFGSVYGCLSGCLFLWFIIRASTSTSWIWIFGAGSTAAAAFLFKPEFGMPCYLTLMLLMALRTFQQRSWKGTLKDLLTIAPGVAACVLVVIWMVSIAGIGFITQENIINWPTSYFMKTYGSSWLRETGLSLSFGYLALAIFRTSFFLGAMLLLKHVLTGWRSDVRSIFWGAALLIAAFAGIVKVLPWQVNGLFRGVFFPRDMVFIVGIAAVAAWSYFWRRGQPDHVRTFAILLSFSSLFAFRSLFRMDAIGYPIYYNAPVTLCFLLLARVVIPRSGRSRRFIMQAELLLCFACLMMALVLVSRRPASKDLVPLTTERGTIRVSKSMAENYRAAIAFMQQKAAQGESVLSVPEDTSLYFLSSTYCPTRVFAFMPGVLAPGKMTDEVIHEIDRQPVRYILWSNRTFGEYGVLLFGVDFDRPLGDYLRAHYRFVGPVGPNQATWYADVWERKSEIRSESGYARPDSAGRADVCAWRSCPRSDGRQVPSRNMKRPASARISTGLLATISDPAGQVGPITPTHVAFGE